MPRPSLIPVGIGIIKQMIAMASLRGTIKTGGPGSSTLSASISHIVIMRAYEQMRWLTAWWIVTMVANLQTIGHRSVGHLPCHDMDPLGMVVYAHFGVASVIAITSPFSTTACCQLAYLRP